MYHRLKTVYAIQHNKTKRIFVGQSEDPQNAVQLRLYRLRNGNDTNERMQKDFNEYGEDYSFFKLEEYNNAESGNRLSYWIYKLNAHDPIKGYNKLRNQKPTEIVFQNGEPKLS